MTETYTPDNLMDPTFPHISGQVTILTGNNLTRGTVLGTVTASGKCVAVDNSKSDGSQTAYAVLADDVDATDGDATGPVFLMGHFNENKLTFGGDDDIDEHRATLRDIGIYTTAWSLA